MACKKGTLPVTVYCGKPTFPPHKGEKVPGVCTRHRQFCVKPGQPKPTYTCHQHWGPYIPNSYPLTFKDCNDAVANFKQALEQQQKKNIGWTKPNYRHWIPNDATWSGKTGNWTASKPIHWFLKDTTVTLPSIGWVDMTAADTAAVLEVTNALRAHEEGHVAIAVEYAQQIDGEVLTVTGKTKAEAEKALSAAIATREQEVNAEDHARHKAYDTKVKDGLEQSNIGGKDCILRCPDIRKRSQIRKRRKGNPVKDDCCE